MNHRHVLFAMIGMAVATACTAQTSLEKAPADTAAAAVADTAMTTITMTKDDGNVVIVKKAGCTADTIVQEQQEHRFSFRERMQTAREKGWGASASFAPGVYAIGTKPVKDLASRAAPLKGRLFNLHTYDYEPFYLSGGMGYVGLGNGIRLGIAGMSGERHFISEPYNGDSAVAMNVKVSWTGLLIDRAVVRGNVNGLFGASVGGGHLSVNARVIDRGIYSMFDRDTMGRMNDDDGLKAGFLYVDPHAGFTCTLMPFFHLGATINVPIFYSPEGFESRTPDFLTVNPGIQIRFILGNLG